ncbi:ABC transporter substrate-binding protein [Microbacterium sp. STN6]|uniref:ABC transporter substrate-binding protein n=1 Tax=Microbacterium sp. STN6 TaxID=2995588 RepID=UPI002260FBC5|nr:ABC transporter substrate-binding protein [Microbacterium sp. STN6]MCX7522999.1 ABC transporter substrate-binding protein [Microbacterium sp. STN6]
MKNRVMAKIAVSVAAVALAATFTGCSSSGSSGGGSEHPLTIGMPNGPQTNNSNPFMATSAASSLGYAWVIYEPLTQWNPTQPAKDPKPWLAKSWKWNDDFTSVAITARDGVKWSDGKPFTAKDIAYTLKLIKDTPALNGNAIPYKDISVSGDTVTATFDSSQLLNQTKVLGTWIVPEHIWSKISDPTKNTNQKPVGTGPYTLKTWSQQVVTLERNNSYWGGKPPVPELRYTSYTDNNAQLTALLSGASQWSYVFIPDIEKTYVSKSKTNNSYQPTGLGIDALFLNTQKAPFNNVAMRQAANMVIDREAVHTQGYSGFKGLVDTVTGLPSPAGDAFTAPEYKGKKATVDVAGAKKVLTEAGYTWKSDKLIDPSGNPVKVTFIDPAGWSDYLASLQIMSDNLAKIGVESSVETPTVDSWTTAVGAGDFQATLHWTNTGATPWDIYSNIMDGTQLKPLGEAASWNFGRFDSPQATTLLADYAVNPDASARQDDLNKIEKIFVEQVPAIPMAAGPLGAEFSTKYWTGWPTKDNPYAASQPTQASAPMILMNLKPVK